jgi:uncharacterized membrane protein
VGFSVLCAFFGVGVAWIPIGILAKTFKPHSDRFVSEIMPILIAGGVIGLVAGLIISIRMARLDKKTAQKIEKKFLGRGDQLRIYFGAPLFVICACLPVFERLSHRFGDNIAIYISLGLIGVLAFSLFLYDRIPARFIIPVGIIGWLLIVLAAFGFCFYTIR